MALPRATLPLLAALGLLASASPAALGAGASGRQGLYYSPQLWTTIDVCNTRAHPHTMGVRASMPGSGRRGEEMFMHFRVQYRDRSGVWRFVAGEDSGPRDVGTGTFAVRQSGFDFHFATGPSPSYVVRGAVLFEWRRKGRVLRSVRKHTTAGHRVAAGADPPGYSASTCRV